MHILDLPSELLSEILVYYIRGEQSRYNYQASSPPFQEWYCFLLVCQRWYSVAIECPQLWDFICIPSSILHVETMVKRSKDVPLYVLSVASDSHRYDKGALALVFDQAHRIEHLDMDITAEVKDLLSIYPSPLPLPIVQYLSVTNNYKSGNFPFGSSTSLHTFTSSRYSLDQLTGVVITPSLRRLNVTPDREEEVGHVLEFLHKTSLAQEAIDNWLRSRSISRIPQLTALRYLTILIITVSSPDVNLLQHLSCPPGLHLGLTVQCGVLDKNVVLEFFEPLLAICGIASPQIAGNKVRAVELSLRARWNFNVRCWTALPSYLGPIVKTRRSNLAVYIEAGPGPDINIEEVCEAFTRSIVTTSLEVLILPDEWSARQRTSIIKALSPMRNIRVLVARNWRWHRLYALLTPQVPRSESSDDDLLIACPEVEDVYVQWLYAKPPDTTSSVVKEPPSPSESSFASQLINMLEQRDAYGSGIARFHLGDDDLGGDVLPAEDREKILQCKAATVMIHK
ncbi:hypothetical protein QCA50_001886 [Cerrena zonata]|uniref:F-box domain-containing protein n=1 Tax=Cerrena zonata TaxID=2478898 RepID=A0AAW0GVX1_9APHY